VHICNAWNEGYVSKVNKAGQITVTFPGDVGSESSELVVFSDTSGQVWIREVWNKKGAKHAGLRKGWLFSPSGRWLVRGQAVGLLAHANTHAHTGTIFFWSVFFLADVIQRSVHCKEHG